MDFDNVPVYIWSSSDASNAGRKDKTNRVVVGYSSIHLVLLTMEGVISLSFLCNLYISIFLSLSLSYNAKVIFRSKTKRKIIVVSFKVLLTTGKRFFFVEQRLTSNYARRNKFAFFFCNEMAYYNLYKQQRLE